MSDFVWFFLVEVRARAGEQQPLVEGSRAMLQCFIPAPDLEGALPRLDKFLGLEAFDRVSVRIVKRFERNADPDEIDNEILSDGISQVASTGTAYRGVMITSKETTRWKDENEQPDQ